MSISEISAGQRGAGAEQGPDERDGGARPGTGRGAHGGQLVLAEPADHGHLGGHRVGLLAEQPAVLVEPVQAGRVHERERPALLDHDRHPVGQLAHHVGAPDLRQRFQPGPHAVGIDPPQVGPAHDAGHFQDALGRHPRGAPHLHRDDGEARRREHPVRRRHHPHHRRRQHRDDADASQPAQAPARPPAPARHALAGDRRGGVAEVAERGRPPARRDEASTHR